MDWEQIENHVIICGWNRKAEIIVREYEAAKAARNEPIVVIADEEQVPDPAELGLSKRVCFLRDDFTKVSALETAGVHRATTCIILADLGHGRTERDADARTILAALTVEKLNPSVYTCAELYNREYGGHLEMGHVNDYVLSNDQSALLLAQAALNRGMMGVIAELLTYQRGNQFYSLAIPSTWVEKTFFELFVHLKQEHEAILIAVRTVAGDLVVNPHDYRLRADDTIIVISDHQIDFK